MFSAPSGKSAGVELPPKEKSSISFRTLSLVILSTIKHYADGILIVSERESVGGVGAHIVVFKAKNRLHLEIREELLRNQKFTVDQELLKYSEVFNPSTSD